MRRRRRSPRHLDRTADLDLGSLVQADVRRSVVSLDHAWPDELIAGRKRRSVDDPPEHADVWKGLDPKNIGWTPEGQLWIFDFGPPTLIERRVAAARVVAGRRVAEGINNSQSRRAAA